MNHSHQGNSAYFDSFALVKEPAASYNYDNDGHLISITETAKQSKAMEYDDDGHLTKYTDPKDYVTTYAYNAHGKSLYDMELIFLRLNVKLLLYDIAVFLCGVLCLAILQLLINLSVLSYAIECVLLIGFFTCIGITFYYRLKTNIVSGFSTI